MVEFKREQLDYLFRIVSGTAADRLATGLRNAHIILSKEEWKSIYFTVIPEGQPPVFTTKNNTHLYHENN